MTTLTAEQRREIEKAGDEPVRIEDPETHATYILIKSEVYDRIKPPSETRYENLRTEPVPEGIRRSREAFLRDLPELLARKRLRGSWVLYHGDERIGIWRNPQKMTREWIKRDLKVDEIYYGVIEPHSEEDHEIETSLFEYEEPEPHS
jgi:hypothetical protein